MASSDLQQTEAASTPSYDNDAILDEIRADISRRGLDGSLPSFDSIPNEGDRWRLYGADHYDRAKYQRYAMEAEERYMVFPDRTFKPGIKSFFKRAIRKTLRFYVQAAVDDQNAFNSSMVNAMNQLAACVDEQQDLLTQQQKLINQLVEERSASNGDAAGV